VPAAKARFTLAEIWRIGVGLLFFLTAWLAPGEVAAQQAIDARRPFHVKYVAEGAVYLDGGQGAGLARDMKLAVRRSDPDHEGEFKNVAEIQVVALASASAVCEVRKLAEGVSALQVGDVAYLSDEDEQTLEASSAGALETRKYAQVITFTEGDPLEEEQREEVPRPPLPEINRRTGLIGMDFGNLDPLQGAPASYQVGSVLRADMTRIGGSYWNFVGYYRGQITSAGAGAGNATVMDLVDRTYQLGFFYVNPNSSWVAGFGRVYLPYAVSLGTIDGGYVGRRLSQHVTAGIFGGSTPDPAVWDYSPGRQIGGTFLNFDYGNFEKLRFVATTGLGVTRIHWDRERDFLFTDTTVSYSRYLSIYNSLQADLLPANYGATITDASGNPIPAPPAGPRSPGLTQSFTTVRIDPDAHVEFSVTDNYFRNPPSFDPRLIGTGLIEQYLFEGLSGGVRLRLPYTLEVYTSIGRDNRTGDATPALNQLYGVAMGNLWHTGIRADVHYSEFDSSFGRGHYAALSFSRQFREVLNVQVQFGQQSLFSTLTRHDNSWWVYSNLDWFAGRHTYLGYNISMYRGGSAPYVQSFLTVGYRF
jgi:hypothetical protein